MAQVILGVDIGTGSSKGVLADLAGTLLGSETRTHTVSRPASGHVEMDGNLWWEEFRELAAALNTGEHQIIAVGVSGMGPCVLLTDSSNEPLRPAILYGVDTRAVEQIESLNLELGGEKKILERCGSALSTQAVGPKLRWVAENEPHVAAAARRLFMPASWLAFKLTGRYGLDHHSASQCTPLYDSGEQDWFVPWSTLVAPWLELPELWWASDILGRVTGEAASNTGLPAGIPVVMGTIDAWSEAVSVDAHGPGDLMLMYGSTMFLVHTLTERRDVPGLWGTVGAYPGTRNMAAGMATSGAITTWLKELFGDADYAGLLVEAEASGVGANGLLMLPYFAGERTPIADPSARGILIGLTLSHSRGDIYRAALEATAFGVRHNIEIMEASGADISRIVAVGGGTQGGLWTQIVSDVTGKEQTIPGKTIGASYGAAFLAARAINPEVDIAKWNPALERSFPRPTATAHYDELYDLYKELYSSTKTIQHALAKRQR